MFTLVRVFQNVSLCSRFASATCTKGESYFTTNELVDFSPTGLASFSRILHWLSNHVERNLNDTRSFKYAAGLKIH